MLILFLSSSIFAQWEELCSDMNIKGVFKKDYNNYLKGDTFLLNRVLYAKNKTTPLMIYLSLNINDFNFGLPLRDYKAIELHPEDVKGIWHRIFIEKKMFQHYDKGLNYDLRNELYTESVDYINNLSSSGLIYEDIILEDYVHSVLLKIMPQNLYNKLPGKNNIYIMKSPAPDNYILANGSLIISTGLLSILDSEEELMAVLTSDLAHYVLDHSLINIKKAISRANRAEFWGGIANALVAVGEEYLYYNNEYYIPGTLSFSTAIVSAAIWSQINQRMGMDYTDTQVREADFIAKYLLSKLNMNPTALSTALTKINNYYHERKDFYPLSENGHFYKLDERIKALGEISEFNDRHYKRQISGVTTFNAITQIVSKDYEAALSFVNRNIDNKVASDEDYVIWAKAQMGLSTAPEDNEKCLEYIEKAIRMSNTPNLNAYKQKILVLIRMNKNYQMERAVQDYLDLLHQYQAQSYSGDDINWVLKEVSWANKLLVKKS